MSESPVKQRMVDTGTTLDLLCVAAILDELVAVFLLCVHLT